MLSKKLQPPLSKQHLPIFVATALIIALPVIVYAHDFEILINEALHSEGLTHILLLPFFAGFLFYQKRNLLKASLVFSKLKPLKAKYIDELVGLSLCLTAFLLHWYGSYTFYPLEYHLLSLPIFTAGVILILFNLKTLKMLILPVLFLFFLIPMPSEIMYMLGGTLANSNTYAAYTLLNTFGLPVTLSTSYGAPAILLKTSSGQQSSFTIDLPCSGIYTFIAFTMFATFLALIASAPLLKKLAIFTIGFLVFEVLNILRITTILSAAYLFGEETAMLIFHTVAGLILTFTGMLLTLFVSEKLLKVKFFSTANKTRQCKKCTADLGSSENFCLNCGRFTEQSVDKPSKTFWAKLAALLLGCSILTLSLNAPAFAIAKETIEITSTGENPGSVFPQMPQYNLRFLYRDVAYERIAKQDASLTYAYYPINISAPVVFVLVGVANSISNLHSWETCLISLPATQGQYPLVPVLDSRDTQLLENPPLTARFLVFQTPENFTQVTLYWFEKATFKTGITVQQKYVRISLAILTRNSTNYPQYEDSLLNFGKTIASYWEPIKTQTLISLGVPAQQSLLVLSIAFIITAKTTQQTSEWRKRTNNLKIFNNLASPKDKLILQAIAELSREKKPITTRDINLSIKRKVGKFMKLERLLERLNRLQEYGFVKMDITVHNNQPSLVWKNLINQ